jgi:preprotein translocase subunit SecY
MAIYVLVLVLIIVFVTLLNTAVRKIPVQYTSSSTKVNGMANDVNYMPFKVNSASVIPVIFASSIMLAPVQIMNYFEEQDWFTYVTNWLGMGTWYSLVLYAVLIWLFTFFYVKLQLEPKRLAEDLQKSGAYIINVRPGDETEHYINKVLSRITVLGALGLVIIALLPQVMPLVNSEITSSMALGGTGLIIVVGVALETTKQIRGILTQNSYKKYYSVAGLNK